MAAAMIGKGIADGQKAKKERASADAANKAIPRQDPGVARHLADIKQRRQYAENGQSRLLALKRRMITNAGQQAQTNLLRGSGNAPGSAQQGLLRSQAVTQQGLSQAGAETEQLANQYLQMETPLISDMADRALSLDTYSRDSKAMQAAQTQQNSNNSISSGMGIMAAGLGDPKVSGTTKSNPAIGPTSGVITQDINASVAGAPSSQATTTPFGATQAPYPGNNYPAEQQPGFAWYVGGRPSWAR